MLHLSHLSCRLHMTALALFCKISTKMQLDAFKPPHTIDQAVPCSNPSSRETLNESKKNRKTLNFRGQSSTWFPTVQVPQFKIHDGCPLVDTGADFEKQTETICRLQRVVLLIRYLGCHFDQEKKTYI